MAETVILGQPLKFWAEDCIGKVSVNKVRGGESFRELYLQLVGRTFEQEGVILGLERDNKELSEHSREFAGRVETLTFQVGIRNEILSIPPGALAAHIVRLGQELGELEATDVPEAAADVRERQAGIDKLGVKLELAQGYQKVIGPFVAELAETAAAVERGTEELGEARKEFEAGAQELRERIVELERDGLPAHTAEIERLKAVLQEKTEAFDALVIEHQELVASAREAEERLGAQVKLLEGQVGEAREAQDVAERTLLEQQRANEDLKLEHARLLREVGEAAGARAEELQRQLDQLREENVQLIERVRVLGEEPGAIIQEKAEMLDRVAGAVLGEAPNLLQLEARVGEHIAAEGRLGQLYDLAHIPRAEGAFDALVGMIQSVARIFTTWGRDDAQSLAAYAADFEPHVAEVNRKAGDYDRVELERANAVRDLGQAQLDLAREQAESKKLLSILGNGFSWTWSTTTAVPRFIYDAMRF